ncbi:hypothetical protein DM02DRAFT_697550 [Periconia macrospinosa]|uniref:Uncharacterized protein n=1 Tax=Periconia macrospinosa TaxID=97972 RepID=A0A2V1D697_9PLEO|nr:hypothetical protein DM02DRAFT_697550 [Periconia macrospinosa]
MLISVEGCLSLSTLKLVSITCTNNVLALLYFLLFSNALAHFFTRSIFSVPSSLR